MSNLQYGYADSTVIVDLELQCIQCGDHFWWAAGEQEFYEARGLSQPRRCSTCRQARRQERETRQESSSQTLVTRTEQAALIRQAAEEVAANLPDVKLPPILRSKNALFGDIEQFLYEAISPIEYRRRTFWEWLGGVDLEAEQLARKAYAARTADELMQQRTAFLNHMRELIDAATAAKLAHIESYIRTREAELRLLKVEDEIQRHHALRGGRLQTEALAEAHAQRQLVEAMRPPEKPKTPTDSVNEERRRVRTRSRAKQSAIDDFLSEIERVYHRHISRAEKAMRIRAVLEAYHQDPDDLPVQIRRLLEEEDDE